MKLRLSIAGLSLALLAAPAAAADELRLDEVVARTSQDLATGSAFEDGALLDQLHRAQLEATGADVSLASPFPAGRHAGRGPITVRQALALVPADERLVVIEMTGAALRAVLERAAAIFERYDFASGHPLLVEGAPESLFVSAGGVTYELDLTAPPGERVAQLALAGAPLDSARALHVATTDGLARRLGLPAPVATGTVWIKDAWISRLRRAGSLEGSYLRRWTLLPDYTFTPERGLLDRAVRLGVLRHEEALRLYPDYPATRGDLAYWLSRAFGWREERLSGAFPDVPDSLEPWLDGLLKRRVIGALATAEFFQPFAPVTLPVALDWSENAAREARYALDTEPERQSFRRGLLAGTSLLAGGKLVAAAAAVTRSQAVAIVTNARFPALRLLHTSDFHGAMLPRDHRGRSRGGSAVLAAHLARLEAENPEGALLVDGGDAFQGTMISNLAYGRPVVEQMNRLGYAAMAIGNHDFDWTVDTLAARIGQMHFAALGANVVEATSGKRPRWAGADTLMVRRGVRVGVLGLAYPGTPMVTLPRNVAMLRFSDDSTTAATLAPRLRRRGAEVVVGLGHIPATMDSLGEVHGALRRLAEGVPGVNVWLGGHDHARVAGEAAGVPVIVPGSSGEVIGVCDLVVDPVRDAVVEHEERLVTTWADEVAPDSAMAALVERWNQSVIALASTPVGRSLRRLGRTGGGESAVGSLVADAVREAADADVALQNGGGLRADLPEGVVTLGAIYEVIPFDNEIVTMTLTGGELRQVLEEALAHGQVLQVSGIRYRFDLGRPQGARVTALLDAEGRPLEEARDFRVACNDFMASGGSNLSKLQRGRDIENTGLDLRRSLEEAVRRRTANGAALDYQGDGRVAREPGSQAPRRGD